MARPISVRNMPDHIRAQYSVPQYLYQTSQHGRRQSEECGKETKMLKFPNTKNVLWDHSSTGPSVCLSISYYRKPKLVISGKVLRLVQRHCENSKQTNCDCSLIGSMQIEDDGEAVVIDIDRFSPYPVTSHHNDETLMSGDILLPLQAKKSPSTEGKVSVEVLESHLQCLKEKCCSKEAVNLSNFLKPYGWCRLYSNAEKSVQHLEFDMVTMATVFKATPIMSVPIVPTALSKNLSGPMSISQVQGEPKSGYLTMDHTRKLLLVLESDPKVSNLPLVGIWVSGVPFTYSPFVWAACIRYLHNSSLNDRVCVPPEPFLLVMYNPLHSKPEFYECVTGKTNHTLVFDLYSACQVVNLSKANPAHNELIELELDTVQSGPKKEVFDQALFHTQNKKSSSEKNSGSRSSPVDDIMPRCHPVPSRASVPVVKSMVPEVTLFFGNDDSDSDYRGTGPSQPPSSRQAKSCDSNRLQNHQTQVMSQRNVYNMTGQPQRTEKPRTSKTRNLKVSNHQVHFQYSPNIEECAYPNPPPVGNQGQITPAQAPLYVSQNIQQQSARHFRNVHAPQFQHLPQSSVFRQPTVNGVPRGNVPGAFQQPFVNGVPHGNVSSAMVNQYGLPLNQPSHRAPGGLTSGQFCPQGQTPSTSIPHQHLPQQMNQGFTNNYSMQSQPFPSQPQIPFQQMPAYSQPSEQQQWPQNQLVSNAGVFTHPAQNIPVTQTNGASNQTSNQNNRHPPSKQMPTNEFASSDMGRNLDSRNPQSGQMVSMQNTDNSRARQHNGPGDQSGRSSDDSGLSVTPEKASLSPKTSGSKALVLSNSPVKSLDTPSLNPGTYNWDQVPPEIYQLLVQQDTQLKHLQSQIEQLLQNQSNSTNSANIPTSEGADSRQEVEKCSVAINTTDHPVPSRQSVSQQTSPRKLCRATSAGSQCGTSDSSQSTNPSSHSEGDPVTPAEIRHKGRIQLNSTEQDFDVDVSQGDLVSVMNDVRLSDKTVDSIQSDMIVDLPSYQSSPSRSRVSKDTGSTGMSSSSRSPISASMCDQQIQYYSGSDRDGDAESDDDCRQERSSPCSASYYDKLMKNIHNLLNQPNEEEEIDPENGNLTLDQSESLAFDDNTTLGKYLSTPLRKPDVNSTFIPKMEYVSMYMEDDNDMSMEINAMAMKYLKDEQLTQLTKLRTSAALRGNKDKQRNVLLRQILKSDKETTPNVTAYGMSPNDMTFATKKYLEKHGLLGDSNSDKAAGVDSPAEDSYRLRLDYSSVSGESDGSAQVTHEVLRNSPNMNFHRSEKTAKHKKQKNVENVFGNHNGQGDYGQRSIDSSPEYSLPMQDVAKSRPFSPLYGEQTKKSGTPRSGENQFRQFSSPVNGDSRRSPLIGQQSPRFGNNEGHVENENDNILDITRLRQLPKLL